MMRLEVVPPLSPAELVALERALGRAEIGLEAKAKRSVTRWRRASAAEAVDSGVAMLCDYARSPRSTPGATRA